MLAIYLLPHRIQGVRIGSQTKMARLRYLDHKRELSRMGWGFCCDRALYRFGLRRWPRARPWGAAALAYCTALLSTGGPKQNEPTPENTLHVPHLQAPTHPLAGLLSFALFYLFD